MLFKIDKTSTEDGVPFRLSGRLQSDDAEELKEDDSSVFPRSLSILRARQSLTWKSSAVPRIDSSGFDVKDPDVIDPIRRG
jgi:ABC-type transporter Mla MlaB component